MSGTQVSAWQTPNELLTSMETPALVQRNQLMNQEAQQTISSNEMEQISRASNWVISQDPENKDPAKQAAAYGAAVKLLRANNFAMKAPDQYPGFDAMQMMARQGTPSKEQYALNVNQQAKTGLLPPEGGGAGGGSTAPSQLAIPPRGAGGPGTTAQLPPEYLQYFREASAETGIPMDLLIAQARQESTFNPNAKGAAGEIGMFQIKSSTAQSPGFGMTGVDPASLTGNTPEAIRNNILFGARYLRARMGQGDPNNPAVQAQGLAGYNGGGDPNYVANVSRYRPGFSPTDPNAAVTTYAAAPPGGGTTPPPYRVAQAGPLTTPPPAATTAPPAALPADQAIAAAQRTGQPVPVADRPGFFATPQGTFTDQPAREAAAPAAASPTQAQTPGPAAAPPPAADLPAIQPPPAPAKLTGGYNDSQLAALRKAANDPTVSADEFRKQQNSYLTANSAANEKYYQDTVTYAREMRERAAMLDKRAKDAVDEQRLAQTAKLAAEAAQRAVDAAQRQKEQHDLTMRTQNLPVGQERDASGTAKDIPGARQPPPPGYRYNAQGGQEIIPGGPADPATLAAQAKARGEGGRPLPSNERDKLIKLAGSIDESGILANNFADYGGFYSSNVGDLVNYVARNTPGDSSRADWWQEYQRQKIAARQGVSGQSLTATEKSEFDKADINPGMSNEIIRKNLARQQEILQRSRDRYVLSLSGDYNPNAIEEAAGVRLEDSKSRMSKDIIEQGTKNKPLANTKIKVDASGKIITGANVQ